MGIPENDYQILKLTNLFYQKYPNPPFVEIMNKSNRAYSCLLFQSHYDYFICVPYRTEISHKYAFHFKKTKRSRIHKSGLDYTKIIIISNGDFIDDKDALIDKDEYKETVRNIEKIKKDALEYVEEYIEHVKGVKCMHEREFARKYSYSTLKYFHKEMGL